MDNIIKNLNYTAEEINDILASVSTKARESELVDVKNDLNNLSTYVHEEFKKKTTLAEYGIEDAYISETTITLGETSIEVATTTALNTAVSDLTSLIETNKQNISNLLSDLESLESRVVTIERKTTITDYGITDAKIEDGVIILGEKSITPATSEGLSQAVAGLNVLIEEKANESDLTEMGTNVGIIAENVETLTTNLLTTDSNVSALQELVNGLFTDKSTLAAYGITDAKIEVDKVTLGEVTIEPLTKNSWEVEKQKLLLEIEKLNNRLDILESLEVPDNTLVDSEGNTFVTEDRNYFVTKQLN